VKIDTVDIMGQPVCPIDLTPVKREGELCSVECWLQLHTSIHLMGDEVNEMKYLDITQQPWYSEAIYGNHT
jgi:hypothetical protein